MDDYRDYRLTIDDVCSQLRITKRALYHRIERRGLFAAKKFGRRLYFSQEVFNTPLALAG